MPQYDNLLTYLARSGKVNQKEALALLSYSYEPTKYRTLDRLVMANRLQRFSENGTVYYRLPIRQYEFPTKPEHNNGDVRLKAVAFSSLYQHIVKYGIDYSALPARLRYMQLLKIWVNHFREYLQFIQPLIEIIDNPPGLDEFKVIEKALNNAGWKWNDSDPIEWLEKFFDTFNPEFEDKFGVSSESWKTLDDISDKSTNLILIENSSSEKETS